MAPVDVQVVHKTTTNRPEDYFVNTLHFDGVAGTAGWGDLAGAIHAAYQSHVDGFLNSMIIGRIVKVYTAGRNPAGPDYEESFAAAGTGGIGPTEVALCLSFYADYNQPRRRGRLYLGPIGGDLGERPSPALMDSVIDFGQALQDIGVGPQYAWQVASRVTGERASVTDWWVDNAWDTQRRRGLRPTDRRTAS